MGGLALTLGSPAVCLGLAPASRFHLLMKHRSGVQSPAQAKQFACASPSNKTNPIRNTGFVLFVEMGGLNPRPGLKFLKRYKFIQFILDSSLRTGKIGSYPH